MTERKLVDDPDLQPEKIYPVTVTALLDSHPELRPVVVDGLLREGETANVIAPPKTGKSFLAGNLAWCVADGRPWLSHDCRQGRVLIIDNELHPETLANRLTRIADAMQIPLDAREQVEVISLRGRLTPISVLQFTAKVEPGRYKLVVLDALYRMVPAGVSENDNSGMMQIYNDLDRLADQWQAAIVVVHHTSKGQQGEKALTDVGSGAGSISRAADTHIAIRPHESKGYHVLEAVVRSFPQPDPVSVCYEYPLWNATTLAPEVKTANRGQERQQKNNAEADGMIEKILKAAKTPMSTSDLRRETGMGDQRISGSLFRLGEKGCVKCKPMKSKKTGKRCQRFSWAEKE